MTQAVQALPGDPLEGITSIGEMVAYWARTTPDAPAVWENDQPTSYAQLWRAIQASRAVLQQQGVVAGDRVVVVSENSVAQIALLFAAVAQDAWPLLINARMAPREIDAILELASPRVSCYTTDVSPDAAAHARRLGARPWQGPDLPNGVALCLHPDCREPETGELARNTAVLIATSGSTGAPKAVLVPHRGLLHFARVSRRARQLRCDDVVYAVLPMSHIFGIGTLMTVTFYGGASLYLEPRFSPEALLDAMTRRGVSMLFGVPTLYVRLMSWLTDHMREQGLQQLPPHRVRYAYVGAASLELPLKQAFEQLFGCRLHHGYGMTEYAGSMFITRFDRPRDDTSVGYLNEGCEVTLRDKDGAEVAVGEVGEIWIRGPGLMLGYYRAPELTAQVMKPGGWFNTGDLGRFEEAPARPPGAAGNLGAAQRFPEDCALFMVGRSKDMIIRSGFNVYPAEVEAALNTHSSIHMSAVLGRREADGNEQVIAFVELQPGAALDLTALDAYLRERLAPYKLPHQVIVMDALPLLSNGKLAKQVLREQLNP